MGFAHRTRFRYEGENTCDECGAPGEWCFAYAEDEISMGSDGATSGVTYGTYLCKLHQVEKALAGIQIRPDSI